MALPAEEGYRYCPKCERWVAANNLHCDLCQACPSKDGRTYRHCAQCQRCVKPTYAHCDSCNRCFHADGHSCEGGRNAVVRGISAKRSATDALEDLVAKTDNKRARKKRKRSKKGKN